MSNIFIISAPSGCGKTSLVKELCLSYSFLKQTISHTTRKMRFGEINGRDYIFTNTKDFINNINGNKFIEHQQVYDNFYGTSFDSIRQITESGQDAVLEIDYKGMLSIKSAIPSAISIYIMPPSITELQNRLIARGLDNREVINKRVSQAANELNYSRFSDYTIVNDDFNYALKALKSLVLWSKISRNKLFN